MGKGVKALQESGVSVSGNGGFDIGRVLSSRNEEHVKALEALGVCSDVSCGGCERDDWRKGDVCVPNFMPKELLEGVSLVLPSPPPSSKKKKIDSHKNNDKNPHGENTNDEDKIFATFLLENIPTISSSTVVDVAGGKGKVSIELCMNGIDCVVVDPGGERSV